MRRADTAKDKPEAAVTPEQPPRCVISTKRPPSYGRLSAGSRQCVGRKQGGVKLAQLIAIIAALTVIGLIYTSGINSPAHAEPQTRLYDAGGNSIRTALPQGEETLRT